MMFDESRVIPMAVGVDVGRIDVDVGRIDVDVGRVDVDVGGVDVDATIASLTSAVTENVDVSCSLARTSYANLFLAPLL